MSDLSGLRRGHSYYEATARGRISGLLDSNSFHELLGPAERLISPHLDTILGMFMKVVNWWIRCFLLFTIQAIDIEVDTT